MPSLAELEASIARSPSAIVAFSGGVDSSLVAAAAARVLGRRALAVTAVSPSVAAGELEGARSVARAVGIPHEIIRTDELGRLGYRRNGPDRCFHCKTELYEQLSSLAVERGYATLLSGANVDDLGDWRPGLRAAERFAVRHPLVEASFRKADVRAMSRELGVPSADKPAMPCLASRVPFGTPIDADVLRRIDRAEAALRALGFREFRVRHLGEGARVEISATELPRALGRDGEAVRRAVRDAGYADVKIDPRPFRSGSLTEGLRRPLPIVDRQG